jgi:ionotropic glutamate receptor
MLCFPAYDVWCLGSGKRPTTMNMFWLLVLIFCYGLFIGTGAGVRVSTRPNVVNVGAIFSFNSSIGKVAKVAIEAAVEDVNSNPALLKGTKLKLAMQDTKLSSGFLGIVEGTFS